LKLLFRAIHPSVLLLFTCSAAGCGDSARARLPAPEEEPKSAEIDLGVTLQRISGFGASTAWTAPNLSDELSDELFSAELGIGLSLVRLRIEPSGDTAEVETARKAVERGARVWASPWTPPGMWKTNNSDTNGGSLLSEYYDDWADRLAGFAETMEQRGLPLAMLSAQNEPNWTAQWETCRWTPSEFLTFIRDHLGPALATRGLTTPVLAPETIDWGSVQDYADQLLGDPAAREMVGAIATHGYGGSPFPYPDLATHDKEFWVTELDDGSDGVDRTMISGLRVAGLIHDHLTIAGVSAWHYWWIAPRGDLPITTNAALIDDQGLTRRAHVLGNWSKFVRPGFFRVEATAQPQRGVRVTAFRDPSSEKLVIVASNHLFDDKEQTFTFSGGGVSELARFVTTDDAPLAESEPIGVSDGVFTAVLPALSVTTLVGEVSKNGPEGTGGASGSEGGGAGVNAVAGNAGEAGRG
jgi:glucuronoarabinoxylan endo-1,4-beta-xylanase